MKKLLALLVLPVFFAPLSTVTSEQDFVLSDEGKYQLHQTGQFSYFEQLPANPNVYQETLTYSDVDLQQPSGKILSPNQAFTIKSLVLNSQARPVFALADGTYVEASQQLIFDDQLLGQEAFGQTLWTKADVQLYEAPYTSGVKIVKTNLKPYQQVTVSKKAYTAHGTYFLVEGQGWLREDSLSTTDNRMEAVQPLLNQKYQKSNLSIYVKQINTQIEAGINADKIMYSASITKLPMLYYIGQRLSLGSVKLTDQYKYIPEVNDYDGAFDTAGSGTISKTPDGKEYSLEHLLKAVAKESDNTASNIAGYYAGNQFGQDYQDLIRSVSGSDWSMTERQVSARAAGLVMEAMYYQDSVIMDYLSETNFDNQRISKDIPVQVAHKIGDAYEYRHDVALVYTDSPFVLSIFTDQSSYEEISAIAKDIYDILK